MNVDQQELAKFGNLAARWWDANSEFKPLHDINPLRLQYIEEKIGGFAGKQVLDVGCGGGILSESMAKKGAIVTAIDMSEAALSVAKLHLYESQVQVTYRAITAEALAVEQPAQFDVVTCMEMLEHVPAPASIIQACHQLVKPNGYTVFSTINRNPKAYLFAILGAEYLLNLLPKGTHDYAKFIRPAELATWAREADLDIQGFTGMSYNPLTKHYWLNADISVNYLAYAQRPA
ncbi:bifunctional 2-polyprenyl-6-hydroxyphenol methylase/3-demethylubiquinol 3-O-methyltransferase UbiG [Beggiatoa leptomitoformis]|uniref:Ubiquinone biosynthesis O-methyltransferase n=2 Tax=Beggiatoa leptomitoformis TaxID=288004 RepID=A0A2N9YAU2_9GAMM|nr:bifunctional 2-polyprenyl-6-hydroxyphenol methylase/3-demethylubiquinol 3-O-methyltransferase UbiG [Beggiatoa leptomitoformis]ALG67055.2 bifunctional 2-polyprenyl-6-hydroxyphenol methylase/3-demethylubiquinol 3-O-methyltransferase UbiG [Beggiatoa leptomitoformis]AUI67562.2 bifunctional 2-polyprenyl-6-hydroxyphenol methylase/3-demethylubiquinol 3-O-methyltransferase UbiG [Beggiatoa leptomitoformis]